MRAAPSPRAAPRPPARRARIVAAIADPGGTRLVLVAPDADALYRRVAAYVAPRAPHVLPPAPARRVAALLLACRCRAAVATYFAHVGRRWDPEWLVVRRADA